MNRTDEELLNAIKYQRKMQARLREMLGEPVEAETEDSARLRVYIGDNVQVQYDGNIVADPIEADGEYLMRHSLDIIRHKYNPDAPMMGKKCTYYLCHFEPCKPMQSVEGWRLHAPECKAVSVKNRKLASDISCDCGKNS